MKPHVTLLLAAVALLSCSKERNGPPILPEETLVAAYADLLVIRERAGLLNQDSTEIRKETDSLLLGYHTDRSGLERSLEPYRRNLTAWKQFYEKVGRRLETIQRDTLQSK